MAIRISPKDRISMIALAEENHYGIDFADGRIGQLIEAGYLTYEGNNLPRLYCTEKGMAVIQVELDERARQRAAAKAEKDAQAAAIQQRETEVANLLTEAGCTRLDYVHFNPHKKCLEVYFYSVLCLYPSHNGRYAIRAYDKHDKLPLIAANIIEEAKQAEIARGVLNAKLTQEQEQAS